MYKVILFCLLSAFSFTSCDLFDTREAEKPSTSRENFPPATSPDVLLTNFIKSYKVKDDNAYAGCFYDVSNSALKYSFSPASGARESYPVFADIWGLDQEVRFFRNLISKVPEGSSINLTFSDSNSVNYGDSVIFTARYSVSVPEQSQTVSFVGQLELKLIVDDRLLWKIYTWLDIRNSTFLTWSDMKGYYYF